MALIISLFLGFIPMFFYAGFIYWLDRYEKEPKLLLGGVFFWGVFVAGFGACVINTTFGIGIGAITGSESVASFATASVVAPVVEEILKGLAVVMVFLFFRKEFDSILDGIVYGSMVGLGFSAIENTLYIYEKGYLASGWGGLAVVAVIRIVLVGWLHACFTAFTGIGLAVARLHKNIVVKLVAPVIGLGIAIGVHAFHNTIGRIVGSGGYDSLGFTLLTDMPGYLLMVGVIVWAIFHERKIMKTYLLEEVTRGLISQAQYQKAQSPWTLTTSIFQGGSTSKFYHLLGELAHKNKQMHQHGDEGRNSAMIEKLRAEIARLAPG